MYRVLLVDDERTILEGISTIVDWESQGVLLAGTAMNGLDAMEFITEQEPDIVISDITMPGLDGIQLLEKVREDFPAIKWIFLSGFSEFEYAQKAMRFGVKHYLLKPCNENYITQALSDIVKELEEQKQKHLYLEDIEKKADEFSYQEQEIIFKELLTNVERSDDKVDYFKKLMKDKLSVEGNVRLLLFHLESPYKFERLALLKETVAEVLGVRIFITYTGVGNDLIVLINDDLMEGQLKDLIVNVQSNYIRHDKLGATIIVSDMCDIYMMNQVYHDMYKQLGQRFYLGAGCIILPNNQRVFSNNDKLLYSYDMEKLILLVKSSHYEDVLSELDYLFSEIEGLQLKPSLVKSYFIQLYLAIAKKSVRHYQEDYLIEVSRLEEMATLEAFKRFFEEVCLYIIQINKQTKGSRYSAVVARMIEEIERNLENPTLSLQWMANEKLFMNSDYLGKLFKKEVGERFSSYVTNTRIERAVRIIEQENDIKVFELAERLGFGNNSQYFSQIFKRITGCTPSDIIKSS
ncbi:response regulator [Radiobacillus sp. PE A8.2]|uniref:response regulator n=1 Tax=Radiobacillus sp. PE A8.2 TaxID=3380349 RepID=UPI00388FC47A